MDTTDTHHRPFPSFPSTNGHHHIGDAEVSRPNGSSGSIDLTGEYDDERDGRSVHHHMITSRKAQVLPPSPLTQQPRPAFVPSDSINMDPTNSPSVDGIQVNGAKLAFPSNLRSGTYTPSFRQFNSPGMAGSSSTPTVLNPPHSPYTFPNISPEQGWASSIPTAGPSLTTPHMIGTNGFGGMGNGRGISASSAIDLTNVRIPSPPPGSDKKPLCIGSIQSRAVMLYPSPAAVIGAQAPEGSKEKYQTVLFRGAELLKVRLKVSICLTCP